MQNVKALQDARKQVAELEEALLQEVKEKAAMLGLSLDGPTAPKQKRTRRTKAQIAADNETANG